MKLWRVDDVMTRDPVAVRKDTPYREVVTMLIDHRVSAAPVIDSCGHVVGVVSEADLPPKVEAGREAAACRGRPRPPGRQRGR